MSPTLLTRSTIVGPANLMSPIFWRTLRKCIVVVVCLVVFFSYADLGDVIMRMITVKRQTTQKVCVEVAGALSTYYHEYEMLPVPRTQVTTDITLDSADPGDVLGILCAKGDPRMNPKHINFIDGMKQAKFSNGKYIDGMNYEGDESRPTLVDAWGKGCRITLDTSEDGLIENPENPGTKISGKRAIVYSAGPDGDFSTWNDNPKSW